MLDCATQDVESNAVTKDLGNDVIFSSANGSVPWPKGKVCLLIVCVFHGCMLVLQYMQHSEMGSYGLSVCFQSRYFKSLTKSHEISLILMVQWLPELRVEVWESYLNIPETDPRHVSRHVVGFEALEVLATHDMGHSMSQYEVVLCQCGDCMRLCCLRCGLEWSGRQMSIVNALQQH